MIDNLKYYVLLTDRLLMYLLGFSPGIANILRANIMYFRGLEKRLAHSKLYLLN